ncbi:MAG TPA: hypothetical protein VFL57_22080 [Bryobacteraceae bacterium]|nr:hypothetical protein [Bryobacteraceae bacterium]
MEPVKLPPPLLSINVIICEVILAETNHMVSAIRIADVFHVHDVPNIPVERQRVQISVLLIGKIAVGDTAQHAIEVRLIRPDGNVTPIGKRFEDSFVPDVERLNVPEGLSVPGGFNISFRLAIEPKQLGTHYIAVSFDGTEIARTPFTLLPRPVQAQTTD